MTFNLSISTSAIRYVHVVRGNHAQCQIMSSKPDFKQDDEFIVQEGPDFLTVVQKTTSVRNGGNVIVQSGRGNVMNLFGRVFTGTVINGDLVGRGGDVQTTDERPDITIMVPQGDVSLKMNVSGNGEYVLCDMKDGDITVTGNADIEIEKFTGDNVSMTVTGNATIASKQSGPVNAKVTGNGTIKCENVTGDVNASVTGNGDISMSGNINDVRASVTGNGDITLRGVTGNVSKNVTGNGDITIR